MTDRATELPYTDALEVERCENLEREINEFRGRINYNYTDVRRLDDLLARAQTCAFSYAESLKASQQSKDEARCACEFPCLSAENKSHDDGCPLYPHDRITESDIVRTIQGDNIDAKNELLRRLGRARLEASLQAFDTVQIPRSIAETARHAIHASLSQSEIGRSLDKAGKPSHWLTTQAEDQLKALVDAIEAAL